MKKVISFSLWGENPKYTIGAIKNADLATIFYPDWICRFYVAKNVPLYIIEELLARNNTEVFVVNEKPDWTAAFWSFFAACDPFVDVMISRDTDSRLGEREMLAVKEWENSDRGFHIMRDHPYHGTTILSGMWGIKKGTVPNMAELIEKHQKEDFYLADDTFLREIIYPLIHDNVLVHDPIFDNKPFPSQRVGYQFVGQVFDENDQPVISHIENLKKFLRSHQEPLVEHRNHRIQEAAAPAACQSSASAPEETAARWAAQLADRPVLGIVFSCDRAMQLDATLRSFHLHCRDAEISTLHVIYKTTNRYHAQQYAQLKREYAEYGYVHFLEETDFRQNVLGLLATQSANSPAGYIMFLVDDSIFVRDFHLDEVCKALARHPAAVGFSLRLGENITDMYVDAKAQILPPLTGIGENMRLFDWTTAQGDFGYPLEVSSSVFRIDELASLLQELAFTEPNTLEWEMSKTRSRFKQQTPHLLCYVRSVAFSAPVNRVQTVSPNRAGARPEYSAAYLAEMFDQDYRIGVDAYVGFAPLSVQQEVELVFERRNIFDRLLSMPGLFLTQEVRKRMKITTYPLYEHVATLQPASAERPWLIEHAAAAELALSTANSTGWVLLCPHAFEATWNGGPNPEDIAIRLDAMDGDAPAFVQSQLGDGLLTFYPGYQVQTEGPNNLWVRGPINRPKDGLSALEQIVDTSLLPCTITVIWQCTRPHQTVRFEAGEPFGVLLPYPQHYTNQFELEVSRPDDVPELFAHQLQQRFQAPVVQEILRRLQNTGEPAAMAERPAVSVPKETAVSRAGQLTKSNPGSVGNVPLAVVIPVRNRAGQHLRNTLRSLAWQTAGRPAQVIVVSFGSRTEIDQDLAAICADEDVTLLTAGTPTQAWNKSFALNYGIRATRPEIPYLMTMDADMILASNFLAAIVQRLQRQPPALVLCRSSDLPAHSTLPDSPQQVLETFQALHASSCLRERTGTGGIQAAQRSFFFEIRGYDEDLIWWGAEDGDVVNRAKRMGLAIEWVEDRTAMLHQWHPSRDAGLTDPCEIEQARNAWGRNHDLVRSRSTIIRRNPEGWGGIAD